MFNLFKVPPWKTNLEGKSVLCSIRSMMKELRILKFVSNFDISDSFFI